MISNRCRDCIWWDNQHPSVENIPIELDKVTPGFCRKHKPGSLFEAYQKLREAPIRQTRARRGVPTNKGAEFPDRDRRNDIKVGQTQRIVFHADPKFLEPDELPFAKKELQNAVKDVPKLRVIRDLLQGSGMATDEDGNEVFVVDVAVETHKQEITVMDVLNQYARNKDWQYLEYRVLGDAITYNAKKNRPKFTF